MDGKKLSNIILLVIFGIFVVLLIIIPSYKMSGYVPSLNKKIKTILKGSPALVIKVVSLGFWDSDISNMDFPSTIDNEMIEIISEITTKPMIKDGYIRKSETKYGEMIVFLNNEKYLFIRLAWDSVREIMELRFDDTTGNTKNRFYKISPVFAGKAFDLMTRQTGSQGVPGQPGEGNDTVPGRDNRSVYQRPWWEYHPCGRGNRGHPVCL
jgi:hypothetical protein